MRKQWSAMLSVKTDGKETRTERIPMVETREPEKDGEIV